MAQVRPKRLTARPLPLMLRQVDRNRCTLYGAIRRAKPLVMIRVYGTRRQIEQTAAEFGITPAKLAAAEKRVQKADAAFQKFVKGLKAERLKAKRRKRAPRA